MHFCYTFLVTQTQTIPYKTFELIYFITLFNGISSIHQSSIQSRVNTNSSFTSCLVLCLTLKYVDNFRFALRRFYLVLSAFPI